jgi:hypothetical protein
MRKFLLLAALLLVAPVASKASPIALDSGWQGFSFQGVGSSFSRTFEFTVGAGEAARLRVTDAFLSGDRFFIFNTNPISGALGSTSAPTSVGDSIGDNYDAAFADSRWSSGQWILGAGSYSIRGITLASPFFSGGGALRVDRVAVSEPATLLLLVLAGFAAFHFSRRDRLTA